MSNALGCTSSNCDVLAGLVDLLGLELVGNALHEATVSPFAFRESQNLLSLQVDNNHFTSVPVGLPRSLQVRWRHNI